MLLLFLMELNDHLPCPIHDQDGGRGLTRMWNHTTTQSINRSFYASAPQGQTLTSHSAKGQTSDRNLTTTLTRTLSSPEISRHRFPAGQ